MTGDTDTETSVVAGFLDNLEEMHSNAVWALIDVAGGGLLLTIAWGAFTHSRWLITVATTLASGYLFLIHSRACIGVQGQNRRAESDE